MEQLHLKTGYICQGPTPLISFMIAITKVLEFMYPDGRSESPSKLNHLFFICVNVNIFFKCVVSSTKYVHNCLPYFTNTQSHATVYLFSINPLFPLVTRIETIQHSFFFPKYVYYSPKHVTNFGNFENT